MPQVPRYGDPKVQEQAMPRARFSTEAPVEAYGGGAAAQQAGQAIRGLAGEIQKVAQQEQEKADNQRLLEERRALNEWEYANIYDPKTGAANKVGKNAFGIHDELNESFNKFKEERRKNLSSDAQRFAFDQLTQSRGEHVMKWAAGHVSQQTKVVEEQEYNASMESSKERGSVDPRNAAIEAVFIQQTAMNRAQSMGWDAETTKQQIQKEESDLHARVVTKMLAGGNDLTASAYFNKVKDRLDPDVATKLTDILEEGSTRGESQRISDKIEGEYSDLTGALAAAKEIQNPKLREAVERRLEHRYGVRERQDTVRREGIFMDSYGLLEKSKSIDAIPPDKWQALLPNQKNALRALEKQLNDPESGKHDDAVYLKYLGMPEGQLAKVSEAHLIMKVRPNLHKQYSDDIFRRWAAAREAAANPANAKKSAEVQSMYTDEEMVFNGLRATKVAGMKDDDAIGTLTGGKATAYREFRERVDKAWQSFHHEHGRAPNGEEKKKIVDGLLIQKVFVKDGWFKDSHKPVMTLSAEERKKAYIPITDIHADKVTKLLNRARAQGAIDPKVSDERAKVLLKSRLERAYGAALVGADDDEIDAILMKD